MFDDLCQEEVRSRVHRGAPPTMIDFTLAERFLYRRAYCMVLTLPGTPLSDRPVQIQRPGAA